MKKVFVALALAVAGSPAGAVTCESLQAAVEARIKAAGVAQFSVTVLDAQAATTDQVVGSCDLGRRKLVYRKGAPAGPAASATAQAATAGVSPTPGAMPAAPAGRPAVLTECKDGSVRTSGDCKK